MTVTKPHFVLPTARVRTQCTKYTTKLSSGSTRAETQCRIFHHIRHISLWNKTSSAQALKTLGTMIFLKEYNMFITCLLHVNYISHLHWLIVCIIYIIGAKAAATPLTCAQWDPKGCKENKVMERQWKSSDPIRPLPSSVLAFPGQVLPPQLFLGTPSRVGRIFKAKAVISTRCHGSRRNYRRKFTSSGSAKLRPAVLSPSPPAAASVLYYFVLCCRELQFPLKLWKDCKVQEVRQVVRQRG